jgi:hypothetical protein
MRHIVDTAALATALQFVTLLVSPAIQAVVDGTNSSFNITLRGVPFQWMTYIDVSNNEISSMFGTQSVMYIDWKLFSIDYLIYIAISVIVIAIVSKFNTAH